MLRKGKQCIIFYWNYDEPQEKNADLYKSYNQEGELAWACQLLFSLLSIDKKKL